MGARRERGAYGNARGVPDKQKRRAEHRQNDPRYQAAMAEVRDNNAMIERLTQQPAEAARLSAEARSKVGLVYVRPDTSVPEPTEEPATPRTTSGGGSRFVDCWCGHTRRWHDGNVAPQCGNSECDCPGYRPITAPDPLAENATQVKFGAELIMSGKESANKRTVTLALKVEALMLDLQARVDEEEEVRLEFERTRAARAAAKERIEALQRELAAEQDRLAGLTKKKPSVVGRRVMKPPTNGSYICPTCDHEPFGTPQGLGSHRHRAHGYRKGDD